MPWAMWGLGASAFFIEYLVRVAPTAIVPNLVETFNASSLDISAFAAYFLYAYVLMQIPVGILVDRFGARLCLSLSTAICAYSTFLFATTSSLPLAQFSRFLFGFGAAFALVGSLKLAIVWFRPQLFSIIVGLSQALGMIGGAAGVYLMARLGASPWQNSLLLFAGSLGVLALFIAVFVRNGSSTTHLSQTTTLSFVTSLKIVFSNRQTWLIGLFAGLLYMPTAVVAELWGSFYLSNTQEIPLKLASDGISLIFMGWALGGPLSGALSNQIGRRPVMMVSAFLSFILMTTILYLPPVPPLFLYILLFCFGLANSGMTAAYTAIAELNPPAVAGIALGFGNGMSVIVGAFCQQIVGILIDWLQLQEIPTALPIAMSIVAVGTLLSFVLSLFIKETVKS